MFQYYSSSELKIINKFEKDGFLIFDIDKIKIKKIRNIVNNQIFKLFKKKNIKIKKEHRSDILNKFNPDIIQSWMYNACLVATIFKIINSSNVESHFIG